MQAGSYEKLPISSCFKINCAGFKRRKENFRIQILITTNCDRLAPRHVRIAQNYEMIDKLDTVCV